ncbi:MAG: class I SAM-dependent methyltransferase [Chloroflexota bacterium]
MEFVAPDTKLPLLQKDYETLRCQVSGVEYHRVDGVWRMILPERMDRFERFIQEYETVRLAEGRQSDDPSFYRELPQTAANHPAAQMWRQRAHSYSVFLEAVLKPLESDLSDLTILDLGAGNGWLSNRLAERGHKVAAIDLTVNDFDGLGVCAAAYESDFVAVQAEFDHLPFEQNQFDLVIFNASFHYSADYAQTLEEMKRVIKSNGQIGIIDTPVYAHQASGQRMVQERECLFEKQFGFKSDQLGSENFLTQIRIMALENQVNMRCHSVQTTPLYRQSIQRVKTLIRGKREPAQFPILVFTNDQALQV